MCKHKESEYNVLSWHHKLDHKIIPVHFNLKYKNSYRFSYFVLLKLKLRENISVIDKADYLLICLDSL